MFSYGGYVLSITEHGTTVDTGISSRWAAIFPKQIHYVIDTTNPYNWAPSGLFIHCHRYSENFHGHLIKGISL